MLSDDPTEEYVVSVGVDEEGVPEMPGVVPTTEDATELDPVDASDERTGELGSCAEGVVLVWGVVLEILVGEVGIEQDAG